MPDEIRTDAENGADTDTDFPGQGDDIDFSSVPPRADYDAADAEQRSDRRKARLRRYLARLPDKLRADKSKAFRKWTVRALAWVRQHDAEAWVRFKEDVTGLRVLRDLEREIGKARRRTAKIGDSVYRATDSGIVWLKASKDGLEEVWLTNFNAEIAAVITRDDGAERERMLEVEARFAGTPTTVDVASGEFDAMRWPHELPVNAYVMPNQERRAAVAIRELSRDPAERTIFCHTGWRKVGGAWAYLHGGGAVGAAGAVADVTTDLGESGGWTLGEPGDLQASVAMLDVAPLRITAPLLGAAVRAVLGNTDFSPFLHGPTGCFKTELAALTQQHFGAALDADHLASFASTANFLEERAFVLKDMVLVIDDYVTSGAAAEVADTRLKGGRLTRAQGNRAGRGRMGRDGKLRPARPPRGLIVMTGEDIPTGHSIRARLVLVEVPPGAVDVARLTEAQGAAAAGDYAGAMAAYIQHLATGLDGRAQWFGARVRGLLPRFRGAHARTPWAFAELAAALEHYLAFAGAEHRTEACLQALEHLAAEQGDYQIDQAVHARFVRHLAAAIEAGDAHVASADDAEAVPPEPEGWGWHWREVHVGQGNLEKVWEPKGPMIGWVRGNDLYLHPANAYKAAQLHARASGNGELGVTEQTLWKRLKEAGLLRSTVGPDAAKARATIWGERRKMLVHVATYLLKTESGPVSGPQNWATEQKPGHSAGAETVADSMSCEAAGPVGPVGPVSDTHTPTESVASQREPRRRNPRAEKVAAIVKGAAARGVKVTRPCTVAGCGRESVSWNGGEDRCDEHWHPDRTYQPVWQCAHCLEPIEPDDAIIDLESGGHLHSKCADAWAQEETP